MNMDKIIDAINSIDETEMVVNNGDVIGFRYEGIMIIASLTDETPARLRFSVDVDNIKWEDDEKLGELLYKLLDLNTEIDPVATAIDSSDPENLMIQVRTTLRVVDLQAEEIVAEVNGLIEALGEVYELVR